jgi:hypothetical protein
MECEFCNKIFKTKSSLNKHKNTTKYCLSIQKNNLNLMEYICICEKTFTNKDNFQQHQNICKIKTYEDKIKTYEDKINILEKNIVEKNLIISNLEGKMFTYQNNQEVIIDIAKQPKNTNTNNTNNTNKILNLTSSLDFDDIEKVKNIIENYNIDYILDGQKGFAKFAVDNLLKDENGNLKYVCTDPSRQIFKYKNNEGLLKKDIEAKKLTNYLVDGGISQKATEISNQWIINEDGKVDKQKFETILQKNDEIMEFTNNNSIFKKELVAFTTI